ncbi:MAG: SDR family oxidoreductase [Comamonadaceae bacterium]|nr:SDR family oxidoreductase [Comamonadaceae bacterium]
MKFNGKTIIVTGGASGIGKACAQFFAARGGKVIIADKQLEAAQGVAEEIVGSSALHLDISDEHQVKQAVDAAERDGPVDALVNCAGILQRTLPPGELSMKEWDLVMHVDLRGTYLCCAVLGPLMAARGRGTIVNIASVAGMRSAPLHSYGPAKAAVIHLTECLAAEWGPQGVRVNAVSPGFTLTPALEKGIASKNLSPHDMVAGSAIGRLVQPEEIAAAVAFLTSDLASGITGINLPVDLGYLVATPWSSYGGLRRSADSGNVR